MGDLENTPLWRYLALVVVVLGIVVSGTWFTVRITTDRLLYDSATRTARDWAEYLAANVSDLEQISAGERPSSASIAFLETTRKAGTIYRYTIFDRYGYSILVADRDKITPVDISDYSEQATLAIKENRVLVGTRDGNPPREPEYYAEAYVPVFVQSRPAAIVAAYVDQADERARFQNRFLVSAFSLSALTAASFVIPAMAWFFRTREKQRADRRLRFLAHHDALTGLANRARLIERLEATMALLPAKDGMIAVHFIDIDHFKEVNDTIGHDGGDFLLSVIGQRLLTMSRIEDMVARLGGDEFVVVQTEVAEKSQAEAFAKRVTETLGAPSYFREQEVRTTYTIGVALAPADGTTAERLLKSADLALYAGKEAGRDCIRFFTPDMDEALQKRIALEKQVRIAVSHNGFVLHYQPIFELESKRLTGFEALIRLATPDGTLIPPATFIPIAEELHLIDKIGAWVLSEACHTATKWPASQTVAVNLSPAQFESGAIEQTVSAALKESGLAPHRLELEITESLLLDHTDETIASLSRLKAMGVSVVMDDFGTGYSSLSYLWKFPFDKIKIDRSFMEGFARSGRDVETVVRTVIALGREMKMRVTVEGVETPGQVDFLYDAHADQVQGFIFGKPMPASEISRPTPDITPPKPMKTQPS